MSCTEKKICQECFKSPAQETTFVCGPCEDYYSGMLQNNDCDPNELAAAGDL